MGKFVKVFLGLILFSPFASYAQNTVTVRSLGFDGRDAGVTINGSGQEFVGCVIEQVRPNSIIQQIEIPSGFSVTQYAGKTLRFGCKEIDSTTQQLGTSRSSVNVLFINQSLQSFSKQLSATQIRQAQENLSSVPNSGYASQPQSQGGYTRPEERQGIFKVPILGAFLQGISDRLPAQSARVGDALKDAPSAYVDRKIAEEKERQERRQKEKEERKKQEEAAKQEQERVAAIAKREQETRDAQVRVEEEQKKQVALEQAKREKDKRDSDAYWEKRAQEGREAQAKIDEERKKQFAIDEAKREQQKKENDAYWVKRTKEGQETQAQLDEARRKQDVVDQAKRDQEQRDNAAYWEKRSQEARAAQSSPQVTTQQAANGQGNGTTSPSLSSNPLYTPPTVSPPQPQVKTLTYQDVLTSEEIAWNNSLPYAQKATTQFSPVQIAEIKKDGRWDPWVSQTKREVAQLAPSKQQMETNPIKNVTPVGLTQHELTWVNYLHPSVKARVLAMSATQINKLKSTGQWEAFRQHIIDISSEINNAQAQSEAAQEEEQIWSDAWNKFQRTVEIGSFALGVGELGITARSLYTVGRAAIGRQAAKEVGSAAAREVDAVGTGGITKVVPNSGKTSVYQSSNANNGEVKYVGISDNLKTRAAAHLGQRGISIDAIPGLQNISREDARAVEQVLIEYHGLEKNGGTLMNKINSIAKTNPKYASALKHGYALLHSVRYPGF